VYKALEAIAYSLKNHSDKAMEQKADEWIAKIAAAQEADGYINSFSIGEQWMEEVRMYVGLITVNAANIQMILQNRVAGRFTNNASWQFFNPSDTSMNRVATISTLYLPFGKQT
jgi:hypothetical protein